MTQGWNLWMLCCSRGVRSGRERGLMNVLLVSPYHGRSSHAAWADGYRRFSKHTFTPLSLPDRSWAWRLRGGAVGLADVVEPECSSCDLILATSMTDVAGLMGLLRHTPLVQKPVVLYMHENQLTYPIRKEGKRDRQLPWLQFSSMICADEVWFNSEHNRRAWFETLPGFLEGLPEPRALGHVEGLRKKSKVMPVGLDLPDERPMPRSELEGDEAPIVVWNQRWDWDKNPEGFVEAIEALLPLVDFRVVLLGPIPKREPPVLQAFKETLGSRLLHAGWCSKPEYLEWLNRATLTFSTARHEFFGISILEAVAHGVHPLLPKALAYPELIPAERFPGCYYTDVEDLVGRALALLREPRGGLRAREELQEVAYQYRWGVVAPRYDEGLSEVYGSLGKLSRS